MNKDILGKFICQKNYTIVILRCCLIDHLILHYFVYYCNEDLFIPSRNREQYARFHFCLKTCTNHFIYTILLETKRMNCQCNNYDTVMALLSTVTNSHKL